MSNALPIHEANHIELKEAFKAWAGQAIAIASPQRTRELFALPISQPSGFRDKTIMAFLKCRAMKRKEDSFFERLHQEFWIGQGGADFSGNCDHRFEDLFIAKQSEDFLKLQEVWRERSHPKIVELGCSSGLLLDYLTRNLSGTRSSIGVELNASQVRRNQQSNHFDPRVEFLQADGGKWLLKHGQRNSLFVTNGGVLEYFTHERLDMMLSHIATNLKPATFFSVEPVAVDHDWRFSKQSIPFGNELSFSHNYLDLFQTNGFQIVHQRSVMFDHWKMVATIAVID